MDEGRQQPRLALPGHQDLVQRLSTQNIPLHQSAQIKVWPWGVRGRGEEGNLSEVPNIEPFHAALQSQAVRFLCFALQQCAGLMLLRGLLTKSWQRES